MKPKNNKRHVGVEIEFFCPHNGLNRDSVKLLINVMLQSALQGICEFDLGSDGSIRPPRGNMPFELRLLIEQTKINKAMEELAPVFEEIKAKVNKSCGLHVHLDCRHRDRELLFFNLVNCQNLFRKMQPVARRRNHFCEPNYSNHFEEHQSMHGKYNAINSHAYEEHRTIEVRVHQGSVDTDEIGKWANLLVRIAARRKELPVVSKLEELSKCVKLKEDEEKYVSEKIKKYNKTIAA